MTSDESSTINIFSTSPASVVLSPLFTHRFPISKKKKVSLEEFIKLAPAAIQELQQSLQEPSKTDPVTSLFHRLDMKQSEVSQYSHTTPLKNYTRNLIATDKQTFTLLLLCWNPNKASPIHDHPCNGCWMRVLQGRVNEKRFVKDTGNNVLVCTQDTTFHQGDETFINDNLGYHKIGNDGEDLAISLHLYSPPFGECRIWCDENDSSKSSISHMCNYFSEYGTLMESAD